MLRATRISRSAALVALGLCVVGAAACRQDMHDQPRLEPYETSRFFADGQGSRVAPAGTVARGALREDALLHRGLAPDGQLSARLPFPLTAQVLRRGQDNFNAFCSPCHDRAGTGRGMVVRRGYKQPPSFHDPRLRESPVGYFFDVMTNGFSTMPSYAAQIRVEDRWAIAAYIRALQLSRNAHLADLNATDIAALDSAAAASAASAASAAAAPPTHAPAHPTTAAPAEGGH